MTNHIPHTTVAKTSMPGETKSPEAEKIVMPEETGLLVIRTSPFISRRTFGLSMLLVSVAGVSAGELIPYHRKAKLSCGLPAGYDYELRKPSLPSVAATLGTLVLVPATVPVSVSNTAVVPTPQGNAVVLSQTSATSVVQTQPAKIVRYWQSAAGELRVDHCAISQVAVWIDETGYWSVNLRAIQDPFIGPDRQATPNARFLRNRFYVKIHAYGSYTVQETPALVRVGKPELFRIEPTPFWVDRSQVELHRATGYLHGPPRCLGPAEIEQLKFVDRLEVEFRYE